MRIGAANFEFRNRDKEFNFSQIRRGLAEASGKEDIICFGEAFLQGFDSLTWDYEADKDMAEERDSELMRSIYSASKEYGVDLIFGYIEREGDRLYSSCAVVMDGVLRHNYRRISRGWKEYSITDGHYAEGDSTVEFDYKGDKLMLSLCGDMWDYPERFKTDGILIWPTYVCFGADEWKGEMEDEYAKQALSAAERTVMIGSVCRDSEPESLGGTFFFKGGEIVLKAEYGRESMIIAEV